MERFHIDRAAALLREQDGVVARRQLRELGATPNDLRRLLRRREIFRAFDGVYVLHGGPLSMRQREWVAVLTAWPAALAAGSALPEPSGTVHVAVAHERSVRLPPGAVLHRVRDLDGQVLWHRSPPRMTLEHALLGRLSGLVAQDDVAGAFHALTQHARRTTPERLLDAVARRPRIAGRLVIRGLLCDWRDGACSVLERGFLHRVERAHGLPAADPQRASRATGRTSLQDLPYPEQRLVVELDGRTFHEGDRADEDAFRDLAEMSVNGLPTLRLTYGLVFRTPCRTARLLAEVLQARGWDGAPRRCHRCSAATRDLG
jgi:hypothetical protein